METLSIVLKIQGFGDWIQEEPTQLGPTERASL
jgi:hypothetical protein